MKSILFFNLKIIFCFEFDSIVYDLLMNIILTKDKPLNMGIPLIPLNFINFNGLIGYQIKNFNINSAARK